MAAAAVFLLRVVGANAAFADGGCPCGRWYSCVVKVTTMPAARTMLRGRAGNGSARDERSSRVLSEARLQSSIWQRTALNSRASMEILQYGPFATISPDI